MARLNKIKVERDLVVIGVLTLILVLLISISSPTWLRVIFGLPFILFFPGYTLMAALFPRKEGLGYTERLVLSFGLSIAIVPLIGLMLNYIWRIDLYPILISLSFFILATSATAWYKRRSYPPGDRFSVPFQYGEHLPRLKWDEFKRLDKVLFFLLIAVILGALGTLAYVIVTPNEGEKFTEFYILGLDREANNYPQELGLGERGEIILGIVNEEHETTSYRVEVWIDEEQVKLWLGESEIEEREIEAGPLDHGEKWEHEISFAPHQIGDDQEVEFRLYTNEDSEPYLILHLYVDVSPS
ncbi:DUF1616 domain-containing protein [Chloroflexota bacterium]